MIRKTELINEKYIITIVIITILGLVHLVYNGMK